MTHFPCFQYVEGMRYNRRRVKNLNNFSRTVSSKQKYFKVHNIISKLFYISQKIETIFYVTNVTCSCQSQDRDTLMLGYLVAHTIRISYNNMLLVIHLALTCRIISHNIATSRIMRVVKLFNKKGFISKTQISLYHVCDKMKLFKKESIGKRYSYGISIFYQFSQFICIYFD